MTKLSRLVSGSLHSSLLILSLCAMALVATTAETSRLAPGESASAQNNNSQTTNSSGTTTKPRRRLPAPRVDPGFERYTGLDSPSRLNRGGATRETDIPRRPVAPLEGRAYDARPYFVWEIAPGSKVYRFAIYEGDRGRDPAARPVYETDVALTSLRYPRNAPVLKPGKLYSWRVSTPTDSGDEVGDIATFIILTGAQRAAVMKALATARLTSPKTRAGRLDQARVFANYGVWYDALEIASQLAEDRKDKDALAYQQALLDKLETKP